ncbi:Lsr2 family DNA-binding protein [Fodinicola acaciae]|uniref:Lsr2 family DNA-binding protein n=1 Tax=Fodinicola acaciae TaxID=2681555 RepID=UPI003CCC8F4B
MTERAGETVYVIDLKRPVGTVRRTRRDSQPAAAEIRSWAQAHDLPFPRRGRLPTALVERYLASER